MKAIVGLGNPGNEYERTRHNVGFAVIDELARRWGARLKSWKGRADLAVVRDRDVVIVEPRTFMNASGEAVLGVMSFYKVLPADVLIVVDEVQLPLGKLRIRASGSSGGHNGLKSVIEHVGTEFPRLRIGVGRGNAERALSDYVLSRFLPAEHDIVERAIKRAADASEVFLADGAMAAMNRFNAPEEPAAEQESEV